jgi:hypothetical protein
VSFPATRAMPAEGERVAVAAAKLAVKNAKHRQSLPPSAIAPTVRRFFTLSELHLNYNYRLNQKIEFIFLIIVI